MNDLEQLLLPAWRTPTPEQVAFGRECARYRAVALAVAIVNLSFSGLSFAGVHIPRVAALAYAVVMMALSIAFFIQLVRFSRAAKRVPQ